MPVAAATTATEGATTGAAGAGNDSDSEARMVCVDVVCPYTRALVVEGLARRRGAWRVTTDRLGVGVMLFGGGGGNVGGGGGGVAAFLLLSSLLF